MGYITVNRTVENDEAKLTVTTTWSPQAKTVITIEDKETSQKASIEIVNDEWAEIVGD